MDRIVFSLREEGKIEYVEGGKFKIVSGGIWLHLSTDHVSDDLVCVANSVDDVSKEEIMDMINPFKVDALLRSNLTDEDYDDVEETLRLSDVYYLNIGDYIGIENPSESQIEEYIAEFKNDVEDAVKTYGEEVYIDFLDDRNEFCIECSTSDSKTVIYKDKYYAGRFITEEILDELLFKHGCSYNN